MRLIRPMFKNRRDFKQADFRNRMLTIGSNASGKALDDLLFMKQAASPRCRFRKAVERRGGMSRMLCPAVGIGTRKARCETNGIFRTAHSA